MGNKVIYLLGAGASCGNRKTQPNLDFGLKSGAILPLVTEFEQAANYLPEVLQETSRLPNGEYKNSIPAEYLWLKTEINALATKVGSSFSVDTLARMHLLSNDIPELHRIKNFIGIVLEFYEIGNGLDNRYEAFLSTIISEVKNGVPKLPNNLTILSWNYDLQIERYMKKIHVNQPEVYLQKNKYLKEGFSFNKLNGDYLVDSNKDFLYLSTEGDREKAAQLLKMRAKEIGSLSEKDLYPNMGFAWDTDQEAMYPDLRVFYRLSEVVVIGYSFPSFNREIDNIILFEVLKEAFRLSKNIRIVIQAAKDSESIAEKVNERLFNLNGQVEPQLVKAVPYHETREFYFSNFIN